MVSSKIQEHGFQDYTVTWNNKVLKEEPKSNLYLKIEDINMIIVVVYVDHTIFGSNFQILSVDFAFEIRK